MSKWIRAALAAGWVAHACALAQPSRIEVTGSRIGGTEAEGATPVQVLTRDDIQRSGAMSLRELIEQLAAAGGGTPDTGAGYSFAAGASGASLRNMGRQATLILLNGRRLAPYPLADYAQVFTNIDGLPFEAIERIEVLKIGGAAMYGSDAVAGVINVVTRSGWRGVQARASRQQSITSGRFGSTTASLAAGFDGLDRGPQVLVSLELFDREGVVWREVLEHVRPEVRERSPGFGSRSTYSWPGNVIGGGPVPGCAASDLIGGLCRYDRYERFEVVPAAQRANLLLNAAQTLGRGQRLFGELLLAHTRTVYRNPYQAYGPGLGSVTWGDPSTGDARSFSYRGLPATHPLNTTGRDEADFRYRFVDAESGSDVRTLQYRALVGVGSPWQGWDWEAAAGLMGGRTTFDQRGWFSASGFREVIGNDDPAQTDPLFFNRAYRIGQVNSAEVIDRLFPVYGYGGHVRQAFVDGRITGTVAQGPAGPVMLALGVDLRHERYAVAPSASLQTGDIVGNGFTASDASRWVGSGWAEVELPLHRDLQLQAAARIDRFGAVAARVSPKLGLRWQLQPSLIVRAAAEGGFRAPNLTETSESTKFSFDNGVVDPLRCPQARRLAEDLSAAAQALPAGSAQATLLQARADNVIINECGAAVASVVRHNPDLQPETSRSASLGLVWSTQRSWKLALDAWAIERHNEIGTETTRELLAAESDRPPGMIGRAPLTGDRSFSADERVRYGVTAGALDTVTDRFKNFGRTRTRGVDVQSHWREATPLGRLDLGLDATYLTSYKAWSNTSSRWGDNLAGRNAYPRWKAVARAALTHGTWTHHLQAVALSATALRDDFYRPDYTDEACAEAGYSKSDCRTAGWVRWDWGLAWRPAESFNARAQVRNLFNRYEPTTLANWLDTGGILPPNYDDPKRRMLRVTLEWRM